MLETILIVTYFKLWNIMNALDKNNNNNNDFLFDTKKKKIYNFIHETFTSCKSVLACLYFFFSNLMRSHIYMYDEGKIN